MNATTPNDIAAGSRRKPATCPDDYEKHDDKVRISCRPSEKRRWLQKWGYRELSRAARDLLNRAADEK